MEFKVTKEKKQEIAEMILLLEQKRKWHKYHIDNADRLLEKARTKVLEAQQELDNLQNLIDNSPSEINHITDQLSRLETQKKIESNADSKLLRLQKMRQKVAELEADLGDIIDLEV